MNPTVRRVLVCIVVLACMATIAWGVALSREPKGPERDLDAWTPPPPYNNPLLNR